MPTYKRSKAEIFNATDTYNFEDEEVGTEDAEDWVATEAAGADLIEIRAGYKGHLKVYYFQDVTGGGTTLVHTFTDGDQDKGSIEYWVAPIFNGTNDRGPWISLMHGDSVICTLQLDIDGSASDDLNFVARGTGITSFLASQLVGNWHHVSMRWRGKNEAGGYEGLNNDEFKIYINGTSYGPYAANSFDHADSLRIHTSLTEGWGYFDAFGWDWAGDYAQGDNAELATETSMTTSNIYSSVVRGKVMDHKIAEMTIDESEVITKGTMIEITDNYSKGGGTASEVMFKGMVTSKSTDYPYKIVVESLAKEDLADKPSGDESGRSDEIITAQTADINHITDGTHENGEAMGTISFLGTKDYRRVWSNLAKMDGSLWYTWYDAGTLKINYNDKDTDTGVNIDQDDNIRMLDEGRPSRRHTKIVVQGLGLASGSATAPDEDIENYGNNIYPHVDRTLSSALCDTCATNLLAVLNNDIQTIRFKYEISGLGYVQEGQTITFAFEEEGSETIDSAEFIVWECAYDTVSGSGTLILMSHPFYGNPASHLIKENADQADLNATNINTLFAIGSANAKYSNCIFYGDTKSPKATLSSNTISNVDGTDFVYCYDIKPDHTLGSLKLYIDELRVAIFDADAAAYVDRLRLYGWTDHDSITLDYDDGTNRTVKGLYTYTPGAAIDVSVYQKVQILLDAIVDAAAELDISYVQIHYYYDT